MAQTLMDEVIIGHEEETWDMADEDKMDEPQAQGKIGQGKISQGNFIDKVDDVVSIDSKDASVQQIVSKQVAVISVDQQLPQITSWKQRPQSAVLTIQTNSMTSIFCLPVTSIFCLPDDNLTAPDVSILVNSNLKETAGKSSLISSDQVEIVASANKGSSSKHNSLRLSLTNKARFPLCQQLLVIGCEDTLQFDSIKSELGRLIHADYKEQICLFIESRVVKADCVDNIELLRLIKSGWIWDNVLPFMAQTLFKELGNLAVSKPKYLQARNNASVSLKKHQVFLLMSQMLFGILPRQLSTHDRPTSFGNVMVIKDTDSRLTLDGKFQKLKCLLHYFSGILRNQQRILKQSTQIIKIQRSRYHIAREVLVPQHSSKKGLEITLSNEVTLHPISTFFGNRFTKSTTVYLVSKSIWDAHSLPPDAAEQLQILIYKKPEIFVLNAVASDLDYGDAIIFHGLEQFSLCRWEERDPAKREDCQQIENFPRKDFVCEDYLTESANCSAEGRQKGAVILLRSKLLENRRTWPQPESISFMRSILGVDGVEEEVSTLYSAFKAHKECRSEQIVFSERYLKFSDQNIFCLYLLLVLIAASVARVKVVFELSENVFKVQRLLYRLRNHQIHSCFQLISCYREFLLQSAASGQHALGFMDYLKEIALL